MAVVYDERVRVSDLTHSHDQSIQDVDRRGNVSSVCRRSHQRNVAHL